MNIDLPKTIDSITKWEAMLADYTIDQLLMTPASDSRSLGQVYMHLI